MFPPIGLTEAEKGGAGPTLPRVAGRSRIE